MLDQLILGECSRASPLALVSSPPAHLGLSLLLQSNSELQQYHATVAHRVRFCSPLCLFWSVGLVHPFGLGFVFGQAGLINRNNINIRRRDPEQKRRKSIRQRKRPSSTDAAAAAVCRNG
ncbi:hypothetical protein pipiens_004980 [Culex pipiens pipiens]|uniref:Uncharacterized protein n=1 Tax=Culex pipiens pipiens TaxID=38569 RepID=A0ABD1CCP3_CULPP